MLLLFFLSILYVHVKHLKQDCIVHFRKNDVSEVNQYKGGVVTRPIRNKDRTTSITLLFIFAFCLSIASSSYHPAQPPASDCEDTTLAVNAVPFINVAISNSNSLELPISFTWTKVGFQQRSQDRQFGGLGFTKLARPDI